MTFGKLPKPHKFRGPGLLSWLSRQFAAPRPEPLSISGGTALPTVPPPSVSKVILVDDHPTSGVLEALHKEPKLQDCDVASLVGSSTGSVFRMHMSGDITSNRMRSQADEDALAEARAKRERKAAAKAARRQPHG